jgi:hypothetical protein
MTTEKDHIVNFIEDEEYYSFKKNKAEVEKGTVAIYVLSTFVLLGYVIFLMVNTASFEWFDLGIGVLTITLYYLLGYYSNYQPFTSFVSMICLLVVVTLLDMLVTSRLNFFSLIIKTVFIVFIFLKLEAARRVQLYLAKHKNK